MTLDTQVLTMISMVVGGIYLGFANETFRRFSVMWKKRVILVYLFEIIFWVIQTSILFYVLYQVNHGEIRFYIFLACLLGFSIYVVLFQSFYRRFLEILIQIVKQAAYITVRTIQELLIEPVKWLLALIVTIAMYVLDIGLTIIFFLLKIVFYPISLCGKLAKRMLPESFLKKITKFRSIYSTILYTLKSRVKALVFKRR